MVRETVSISENNSDIMEMDTELSHAFPRLVNVNEVGKFILPPLLAPEEDEYEMEFKQEEFGAVGAGNWFQVNPPTDTEKHNHLYEKELQEMFEKVDEDKRAECFIAVMKNLFQLAAAPPLKL